MKLVKQAPHSRYTQSPQALIVLFSWVRQEGDKYISQYYGTRCKEYITDVIFWHRGDVKAGQDGQPPIYGLEYPEGFTEHPLMLIEFTSEQHTENFKSNIELFAQLGWPTRIVLEEKNDLVVELDPEWMRTSWRISLWALAVKSFCFNPNKTLAQFWDLPSTEKSHYNAAMMKCPGVMDKLLKHVRDIPIDEFVYPSTSVDVDDEEEESGTFLYQMHQGLGVFNTFVYRYCIQPVYYERLQGIKEECLAA